MSVKQNQKNTDKYIESIGRRKSAIARVRLIPNDNFNYVVNDVTGNDYFKVIEHQNLIRSPFNIINSDTKFSVSAKVNGSGLSAQAQALRLGISRALVKFSEEFRTDLKNAGYLKRDPRSTERKKPGLKKARKRPQWSKR